VQRWAFGEALPVVAPDEAKKALESFPAGAVPDSGDEALVTNFAIGRALVLADRHREAEPFLRAATGRCVGFEFPLIRARAEYLFGEALERKGDVQGACAAYGSLLDRWGKTKPVSATAVAARKRRTGLKCP
jgi:hypothetical protein